MKSREEVSLMTIYAIDNFTPSDTSDVVAIQYSRQKSNTHPECILTNLSARIAAAFNTARIAGWMTSILHLDRIQYNLDTRLLRIRTSINRWRWSGVDLEGGCQDKA